MSPAPDVPSENVAVLQENLRSQGASQFDPIGWHYIETLADRTHAQTGAAQPLLNRKLHEELQRFQALMVNAHGNNMERVHHAGSTHDKGLNSPLSALLIEMTRHASSESLGDKPPSGRPENPRVQQFRQQLHKISVQKSVTQAIAQAPQNAGPINSHMLVLRALGLMRDICPDYLNRFMLYADTLLSLDEAGQARITPKKSAPAAKSKK
jgi:hypothetical protein